LNVIVPARVLVAVVIAPAEVIVVNGVEKPVLVKVAALPVLLTVACALDVTASPSATVTDESVGLVMELITASVSVADRAAAALTANVVLTALPTIAVTDGVVIVITEGVVVFVPAFAGTTDKSPNPSEAVATTATFFNEIVFTIFLSFSQIKVVLLSGW
jgi:hypothetical protein